jgi:DNA-binding beta-propeller fold protein YncE
LIFSGNDSTDKIDVYQEMRRRKGGRKKSLNEETVKYTKRFSFPLTKKDKVQALDIEVDQATKKVFVVDGLKKEIQVYDLRGRLLSTLGGFGDLTMPKGLALDPAAEEVFVSDYGDAGRGISAAIKVFDYSGKLLRSITGQFGRPHGVDVADERIFFVDSLLGQVLEFDRNQGGQIAAHGCVGSDAGHMRLPRDLIYNASLGAVFVADFRNQRVTRVDVKGISP